MPATCSTSVPHSSLFLSPSGRGKIELQAGCSCTVNNGCDSRRNGRIERRLLAVISPFTSAYQRRNRIPGRNFLPVFLRSNLGRGWIFSTYELESHLCYIPDNFPDAFYLARHCCQ